MHPLNYNYILSKWTKQSYEKGKCL